MVAFPSSRTKNAVRRGALGFALALPLISGLPVAAQNEATVSEVEEADVEEVQVDAEADQSAEVIEDEATVEQIEVTPAPDAVPVAEPIPEAPGEPRVLILSLIHI